VQMQTPLRTAQHIMLDFADKTGLSPGEPTPRRYLWTDAFALCNFMELHHRTGSEKFRLLAIRLVDQVHHVLGRHRRDDFRSGWISGLDEAEGERHPTGGGLRIGKALNERQAGEFFDEHSEWDRDGQYFHYLTKWMHALFRMGRMTGEGAYLRQAVELAKTAHARFTYGSSVGGAKRMYWKMSIDFSRPLVPSMGHHDPLDGFITYSELQAALSHDADRSASLALDEEIADTAAMCRGVNWATDDPLGLGGIMSDAYRVGQLIMGGNLELIGLLEELLSAAVKGMEAFVIRSPLDLPAACRLAFREFGLSIGLQAVNKLQGLMTGNREIFNKSTLLTRGEILNQQGQVGDAVERFWLQPSHRESNNWTAHRDINNVMLATSLIPDGFLSL
jgi:hypothetical protein